MKAVSKNTRRGFWGRRLDEKIEPAGLRMWGFVQWFLNVFLLYAVLALVLGYLSMFAAQWIFLSPGLFEYGLADPIGRGLAAVCLASGRCDLRYLLSGLVMALLVVALVFILLHHALRVTDDDDGETVSEGELVEGLQLLDERIVSLRADLVLGGVLKPRADELPESEAPQ